MSNIVDTFNNALDEIQSASGKPIDNNTRGRLYSGMQKRRFEFTRANVRLLYFEHFGNVMPAGVMTSEERGEWQRNQDDANLSADEYRAKYALAAKNDRVTKDSLSPEGRELARIEKANKEAIAAAKAKDAAARAFATRDFMALINAPDVSLFEHADYWNYCDKIVPAERKKLSPDTLFQKLSIAVDAVNREIATTGQAPLSEPEIAVMIDLAESKNYDVLDSDGNALFAAFKSLTAAKLIRHTVAPTEPELESVPETNPYEPSDSENSLYAKWIAHTP